MTRTTKTSSSKSPPTPAAIASVLTQLEDPRLSALTVDDVRVRITHPDRVLWPAAEDQSAVTRRDLLRYFACVAPVVLPHLRDRPLTLRRFPTGITGKRFYQKHVEFEPPEYVDRVRLYAEEHAADGDHVVCNNLPTLLWLAQIANLELHPWSSRITGEPDALDLPTSSTGSVETLEASVVNYPDFIVFDLDPYLYSGHERKGAEPELHREGFLRACEAATWLHEVLDGLALSSYVKTSGKTGLHIFVPIVRQLNYDAVRLLSGQICQFVLRQHPSELTMEWTVARRRGKVFLDHNQNTRGKTLAAPYSARALPGTPVSTPLTWDELGRVYPTEFTLRTIERRLERVGDPWADILSAKHDLSQTLGASTSA